MRYQLTTYVVLAAGAVPIGTSGDEESMRKLLGVDFDALLGCGALVAMVDDEEVISESANDEGSGEQLSPPTILEAIASLDPNDESLYTKSGKPTVEALEAVLGYAVTAAERDAALDDAS